MRRWSKHFAYGASTSCYFVGNIAVLLNSMDKHIDVKNEDHSTDPAEKGAASTH